MRQPHGGGTSALEELGQLHGDGDSSLPQWAEYGIYAALIIAIIQIYVGFSVPDGSLLLLIGIGFLALGLWAGARMNEELAAAWERFNDWRAEE